MYAMEIWFADVMVNKLKPLISYFAEPIPVNFHCQRILREVLSVPVLTDHDDARRCLIEMIGWDVSRSATHSILFRDTNLERCDADATYLLQSATRMAMVLMPPTGGAPRTP